MFSGGRDVGEGWGRGLVCLLFFFRFEFDRICELVRRRVILVNRWVYFGSVIDGFVCGKCF